MHAKSIHVLMGTLSVLALGGCATAPMTLSQQDSSAIEGQKLTVIHYEPDPFLPMTNTKGAFALLGVAAAVSEGKTLVKEKGLSDPAVAITHDLASSLDNRYHFNSVNLLPEARPYQSDPKDVSAMAGNQGVVLDVRTFGWGTQYYPFKTQYKVNYFAQARLINASEGRLVSTERCTINEPYSENAPTYDQLMDNDAALLKQKLAEAETECVKQFTAKMASGSGQVADNSATTDR
jgi:hypothetical protein